MNCLLCWRLAFSWWWKAYLQTDRKTDGRTLTWLVGHKNRTYFFFIALKKRYIKEAKKKTQRKRQKLNIKLFVQLNCNYKYFGVLRYLVRIFFASVRPTKEQQFCRYAAYYKYLSWCCLFHQQIKHFSSILSHPYTQRKKWLETGCINNYMLLTNFLFLLQ